MTDWKDYMRNRAQELGISQAKFKSTPEYREWYSEWKKANPRTRRKKVQTVTIVQRENGKFQIKLDSMKNGYLGNGPAHSFFCGIAEFDDVESATTYAIKYRYQVTQ